MPTEKKEKTTKMTTKKAEPVEKKTTTKKNTKPATKRRLVQDQLQKRN